MSEQEVGFEDWQEQADKIVITKAKEEETKQVNELSEEMVKQNPQQHVDPHEQHLGRIQRIKNMSPAEFQAEFVSKDGDQTRRIQPFSALMKTEKQFAELATLLGSRLRAQAKQSPEKVLPQGETVAFFEEFLLYLYGDLQWESIETVKEKTKIVKKQKKEEQAKVKKMREKEMRLRRGFNKQENHQKQIETPKRQHQQPYIDEGM